MQLKYKTVMLTGGASGIGRATALMLAGEGARILLCDMNKEGAEETPVMTSTGSFSKAAEDHVTNFLQCVRTRATPNASVEKGFQAALVVQLANLSLRQGRRMKWNGTLRRVEV